MRYLGMTLSILKNSHTNPQSPIKEADRTDILNLCLRQTRALSLGLWEPTDKEDVDLKEIIHTIPLLFTDRIHAFSLQVEIRIPPKLMATLRGEPVFMEVILINAIGKSIYRAQKNGRVHISLWEENGCYHLEIQDNGFILTETAADLLTNACDLFIEHDAFQQLCQDNGIGYETSKTNDGSMNITRLMLSSPQGDIANRNEVRGFF